MKPDDKKKTIEATKILNIPIFSTPIISLPLDPFFSTPIILLPLDLLHCFWGVTTIQVEKENPNE